MEAVNQLGSWIYALGGFTLLALLLLVLWYRMRLTTKKFERDLKMLESQYQDKVIESHRHFVEKQEFYIQEKLNELNIKEKGLSKAISSLEESNNEMLDKLLHKFEKKIAQIEENNEKESEKRIQEVEARYEKKINEIQEQKDKETAVLKKDREKILAELEEYQRDLQEKSKLEMEKIHAQYQKQMDHLQSENSKLLDEMNRMLEIKKKASLPPPPLPKRFTPRELDPVRFSEETLSQIETQIHSTAQEMEKLKEQFTELQTKSKREFQVSQQEIEELKMKIRHGEMKG